MAIAWDKTKVREGIPAPALNDEIRENWDALETALNKEMYFSTGGTASLQGILKQGSARMFSQASAPATRVDGSAFASTDLGSIWIDTDNNKIYTLTAIGPVVWTLISTEIIALLVSQINTWALAQTLSVSPVFTKGIVANATYLKGRNEADDANTDMIQVGRNEADDTDVVQLPDEARLASNAAPTEDTQLTIKKYVDDQLAFSTTTDEDADTAAMVIGTEYTAITDGNVCILYRDTVVSGVVLSLIVSGTTIQQETVTNNGDRASLSYTIKTGETFQFTVSSGSPTTEVITWRSRGPLSKPTK